MRLSTSLVICLWLTGCDQITPQINQPAPAPQPNVAKAEPQRPPVIKVVETPVESEPETQPAPPVQPKPEPVPEPVIPRSVGVVQRSAIPKRVGSKTGVEFLLVVQLEGDDFETYQYQVVMSDEDGNTKTVPMRVNGETAVMNEFVPGAGVGQTFSFQITYTDPAKMEPGEVDGFGKGVFKFAH